MKHQSKFSSGEEQISRQQTHQRQESSQEFAQSDELLRFDATQTTVPPEIAARLQKSSADIAPPTPRPWWKAWLRR